MSTNGASFAVDCAIAAGNEHVVTLENSRIQWYDKNGALQFDQSLFSFFNNPGGTAIGASRAIYDAVNDRFVVLTNAWDGGKICLAVSKDSDPNHGWNFTTLNTDLTINGLKSWAEFPGLATDGQAIYVTGRMSSIGNDRIRNTPDDVFQETRLWIVNDGVGSGGLYDGGTARVSEFSANAITGGTSNSLGQPAQILSPTGGTFGTFLVNTNDRGRVQLIRIDNPTTTPTFTFQGLLGTPFGSYSTDSPQPGTSAKLNTHPTGNAVWRNGALYVVDVVGPVGGPDAGIATAHWYKIDTTNLNALAIVDQGDVSGSALGAGPGVATHQPSISANANGDFLITFSASGPGLYAGAYYALHVAGDAPGTLRGAQVLHAGEAPYELRNPFGVVRWGDYSSTSLDPVDGTTFWIFNQYAALRAAGQAGNWATQIAAVPSPLVRLALTGAGNFDTNGRFDLAFSSGGTAALWLAGNTGFSEATIPNARMGAEWKAAKTGDFNADGLTDILWTQSSGVAAIWLLNGSNLAQVGIPAGRMGAEWQVAGVGDLTGDRKADIVWGDNSGQAAVWSMDGITLGGVGISNGRMGPEWSITALGDFNADAKQDLLWISTGGGVAEWIMNGSNLAGVVDVGRIGSEWHVGGTGDFNADGTSDIVWVDRNNNVQVWTVSAGRIAQFISPAGRNGLEWNLAAVADFTGDRNADLLWLTGGGLAQIWSLDGPRIILSQMTTPRDSAPSTAPVPATPILRAPATAPSTRFEDVAAPDPSGVAGAATGIMAAAYDTGDGYGPIVDGASLGQFAAPDPTWQLQ